MYKKKIYLNDQSIILYFSELPFFDNSKTIVFGAPLNLKKNNLVAFDSLKGYWVKLEISKNSLKITNDILGGYRVYYFKNKCEIIISDDFDYILNQFKIKPKKHAVEYKYWQKHGFSTGQSTFYKGLNKISPASILTIEETSIKEDSYFSDIDRKPDARLHQKSIHNDLLDTFSLIKTSDKRIVLLFSGGKDSCLLLQYLLKFKIPFTPVFFRLKSMSIYGSQDLIRVRNASKSLGLNLEEIEIDLKTLPISLKQEILNKQRFDKHFSLLHYMGNNEIKNRFGGNCLIVNGQSADSILSYGPSEDSIMSFFRRHIMYNSNSILSKIGLILLMLKTGKRFKLPKTENEKLIALFDEYKYTRVLDCSLDQAYFDYIFDFIERKTRHLKSYFSKEMYTKILSFSQGSDNQVVVNSSKYYGLKTIMPFATPKIIYETIRFKDEKKEINKPKYAVENILKKEFNFDYKKIVETKVKVKTKN